PYFVFHIVLFHLSSSYALHRDFASFPTRRSSDLSITVAKVWSANTTNSTSSPDPAIGPSTGSHPLSRARWRNSWNSGFAATRNGATAKPLFQDRKSTRLNSSHVKISYAVCCMKKNT